MVQFIEATLCTNRAMHSNEKEVVTKQLKYTPKQKGGEENQNLEDWTNATNVDKNWTHNRNRSWIFKSLEI